MNVFVHVQLFVRFYFLFVMFNMQLISVPLFELMIRILLFVKTMTRILVPKYRTKLIVVSKYRIKVILLVFHLHFVVWV